MIVLAEISRSPACRCRGVGQITYSVFCQYLCSPGAALDRAVWCVRLSSALRRLAPGTGAPFLFPIIGCFLCHQFQSPPPEFVARGSRTGERFLLGISHYPPAAPAAGQQQQQPLLQRQRWKNLVWLALFLVVIMRVAVLTVVCNVFTGLSANGTPGATRKADDEMRVLSTLLVAVCRCSFWPHRLRAAGLLLLLLLLLVVVVLR